MDVDSYVTKCLISHLHDKTHLLKCLAGKIVLEKLVFTEVSRYKIGIEVKRFLLHRFTLAADDG